MGSRGFPASGEKTKGHARVTKRILKTDGKLHPLSFPLVKGYWGIDSDGKEKAWHPQTEKWWEKLRRSAQGRLLSTELDWEAMFDTAVMHHSYHCEPTPAKYAAVKAGLKTIGTNPEDRARLHLDIDVPDDKSVGDPSMSNSGNVTNIADKAAVAEERKLARAQREAERLNKQG